MPKRKDKGPPEIDARPEVNDPEPSPNQDVLFVEHDPSLDCPTGEECHREPTESHLSPALSEVDEGSAPDYISFWDLLSLAEYETW